jgi:predicted nuclease with TOPRIM domain
MSYEQFILGLIGLIAGLFGGPAGIKIWDGLFKVKLRRMDENAKFNHYLETQIADMKREMDVVEAEKSREISDLRERYEGQISKLTAKYDTVEIKSNQDQVHIHQLIGENASLKARVVELEGKTNVLDNFKD